MPKQYMVELAQDERDELEAVLKSSTRRAVSATKLQRARILLAVEHGGAGPALTDMQVGGWRCWGDGADLPARASAGGGAGSDGGSGAQAKAVASGAEEVGWGEGSASGSGACSVPPEGRVRWTVKMLAEELVRLEVVETICGETVRKALKKRIETMAAGNVVHSEEAKPSFRGRHGAGAQGYTGGRTTRGIRWCAWTR